MGSTRVDSDRSREIKGLADEIEHHRRLYYNRQPEITDAEYDALEARLSSLDPEHPLLKDVGALPDGVREAPLELEVHPLLEDVGALPDEVREAPLELEVHRLSQQDIEGVAAALLKATSGAYAGRAEDPKTYKQRFIDLAATAPEHPVFADLVPARGLEWPKVAHEIPMGSLNKVNTESELRDWAARCDELAQAAELSPISGNLSVSEKLDGISVEALYDSGHLEAAITRGNGILGERITPNVRNMHGVPGTIDHPGRVSLRGEIVLRKSDLAAYSELKRAADPKFERVKSLRNTASGVARTKLHEWLPSTKMLTVFFYDVEGIEDLETETSKFLFLQEHGFWTPFRAAGDIEHVLEIYRRYADEQRETLDYEIDGLVVRAESLRASALLGELNRRPRAAVAFKFGNEMAVSRVRGIEWNTGDTGRITPVARVDPVMLAGAEVKQASLHNLGLVRELGIAVGDDVLVSRRNDVIPYVERVVVRGGGREEAPQTCSACGSAVEIDGEYLVCPNVSCPARRLGRIRTWIKHLGLLEWGEKTLVRLYEAELVREPRDLYQLKEEDITSLRGFGTETAKKLLSPLARQKEIPFPVFVAALGIPAVSRETAKLLSGAGLNTVQDVLGAGREQLGEIAGLGAIKAAKIIDGLEGRMEEIARLEEVGVRPVPPESRGPLAGLSFCFTGSHRRPRKALAKLVESQGGEVASSVTKGLSYLVLSDPGSTSSKAQKARKLGVEILDEGGFEALIESRGGSLS